MRAREDGGRERAMKRDVERDSPREMERAWESVKCREDRIPPGLKSGGLLSSVNFALSLALSILLKSCNRH